MRLNRRLALLLTSCCFASPLLAQNTTTPPPSPGSAAPTVQLSTSMGDIVVQLDPAKAPQTVANFFQYVEDKHYDGTIFHRVIDGFMIQGGGMGPDMQE
ncbi:MAG: peptidylprolyl isomerase, partial [Comamonas sp.]|nr:peptidylprolyl isomerase [Comamonas sp.]